MPDLVLRLGVKTDPIQYRYSYPWLFRLMADEGVEHAQLGTFFELYLLPDEFFLHLKEEAARFGVRISSVFSAHRELGGLFRDDPAWHAVAVRCLRRLVEVGALLGAGAVGSSAGAVPRDQMELKWAGTERYLDAMQDLMVYAAQVGVPWLTIEPMSCLAEPPTTPEEIVAFGELLRVHHLRCPVPTSQAGYCVDIAHGYVDADGVNRWDNMDLFLATLPYLQSIHLKNTDSRFDATFGFGEDDRRRGVVDVAAFRDALYANAAQLPVQEVVGYLEIGGPKLGRDYSDPRLEGMLRESLRYLRNVFC